MPDEDSNLVATKKSQVNSVKLDHKRVVKLMEKKSLASIDKIPIWNFGTIGKYSHMC